MIDVLVREIKMPMTYRAFVKVDKDGICNIYLNEDMPDFSKKIALRHEIEHIENGDFESTLPVELLEAANRAEPDMSKVCWIGREPSTNNNSISLRRATKVMSILADGGKIIKINGKKPRTQDQSAAK